MRFRALPKGKMVSKLQIHVLQSRPDVMSGATSVIDRAESAGYSYKIIDNTGKSILNGRKIGYLECQSEFVSFVDDDDETLLSSKNVEDMIALNSNAVFTNSITKTALSESIQISTAFSEWNLMLEKRGYIRPHQTIVYQTAFAVELFLQAEKLIVKNGWHPNSVDHVMRLLVSATVGWKYFPDLTYKWNRHAEGEHAKRLKQNNEIRQFFLR
jgi:hypothetical protein